MRRDWVRGLFRLLAASVLVGCGGGGSSSSENLTPIASPVTSARFAFVSSFDTNIISVFKVDPATGQLSAGAPDISTGACNGPSYVELHSTGRFLFVACQSSNSAVSFSIDPATGALTMVGSPVPAGTTPAILDLHPSGRFLYLTNTGSASLSVYSIGADGSLSEILGSPFATGATPYSVKASDSGAFVYVTNRDSDSVSVFGVDANTGALTEIPGSPFPAGDGARAIEFSGRFAFVANRFADTVSVFTVDPNAGALGQIAGSPFAGGDDPRSMVVDPSGKYLYTVNSSLATGATSITAYSIDGNTGVLTPIAGSPFAVDATLLSAVPLSGEMDESGNLLYVTSSASKSVSVYRVDRSNGTLQRLPGMSTPGITSSIALL